MGSVIFTPNGKFIFYILYIVPTSFALFFGAVYFPYSYWKIQSLQYELDKANFKLWQCSTELELKENIKKQYVHPPRKTNVENSEEGNLLLDVKKPHRFD